MVKDRDAWRQVASGTGHSENQDTISGTFRLMNIKLLLCTKLDFAFRDGWEGDGTEYI